MRGQDFLKKTKHSRTLLYPREDQGHFPKVGCPQRVLAAVMKILWLLMEKGRACDRCTVKKTRVDIRGKAVEIKESGSEGASSRRGREERNGRRAASEMTPRFQKLELRCRRRRNGEVRRGSVLGPRCVFAVRQCIQGKADKMPVETTAGMRKRSITGGERGPRPDEDWLARALSGKGKLQSTAEGIKCPQKLPRSATQRHMLLIPEGSQVRVAFEGTAHF